MGHTNKRDKDGNVIQKPTCIDAYTHSMGGVDLMDQQLDGINVLRKSYKWYKKLFLRLVTQDPYQPTSCTDSMVEKMSFYTFSLMYVLNY